MKKNIIFLILFLVHLFAGSVQAQLLLEEGKVKRTVSPGEKVADSLTLHNTTAVPVDVRAYLEDFEYVPPFNGSKKFYPAGTVKRTAANWISFQPKEVHVPPHTKKKINYTISVPEDASGGYYSVLFFEGMKQQKVTQGQVGLEIVSRVGSLFFLETQDRIKQVSLQEGSVKDFMITGILKNEGNINLVVQCLYYIIDADGIPADRGQTDNFYMPENASLDFSLKFSDELPSGSYIAVLTFDMEDGMSSVEELNFTIE